MSLSCGDIVSWLALGRAFVNIADRQSALKSASGNEPTEKLDVDIP